MSPPAQNALSPLALITTRAIWPRLRPLFELWMDGAHHSKGQRIEGGGTIERNDACVSVLVEQNLAITHGCLPQHRQFSCPPTA